MMLRRNSLTKKTILYVLIFILFFVNTGFYVFASDSSSAPIVNAGADKTVTLPAEIALTGTASGAISTTWSLQSGPAVTNLDILTPNALNAIAMVTYPGIYVFKLTGTNASGSASDTIRIIVNPSVVSAPPSWVSANGFYKKCIVINGIPIVSTEAVADQALINSSYVLDAQLRKIKLTKPAVLQKLVSNRAYVMIVGLNETNNMHPSWSNYNDASWPRRGGGGLNCTILEEDCVVPANDTWRRNFSGQIHEFAHTLLTYGIGDIRGLGAEPQAYPAILAAFNNAVAAGKYSNSSYDVSNYHEYFTGQSNRWFNSNPTDLLVPNASTKTDRQQLQEYDIDMYHILSEYYGDYSLPEPWGPAGTTPIDFVNVTPLSAYVAKGQSQQFAVTGTSPNVTWSLSGANSMDTSIHPTTGELVVAADETASSLTVTATSTEDTQMFGTATVEVYEIISVAITPPTPSVEKGKGLRLNAFVTHTNVNAPVALQSVVWHVEGGSAGTSIDTNGQLTVANDEAASSLTVQATSIDPTKSATVTVVLTDRGPVSAADLVLYYKFNGSGTSGELKDYSQNAYDTTINGTISANAWSEDGFVFSGANYIQLPSSVELVHPEMTIVFKVKRTGDISANGCFFWGKNASNWDGNGMFINTNQGLRVYHNTSATTFHLNTTANTLYPINEWTEVAYSIDTTGSTPKGLLMINGVLVEVTIPDAAKLTHPSASLNLIGAAGYNYNERLTNMVMGKFMIIDRALTQTELLSVYNNTLIQDQADNAALLSLIANANELSEAVYTAESWSVFSAALLVAQIAAADVDTTQADVDAAVASLQAAMDALVFKPIDKKVTLGVRTEAQYDLLDPVTFIVTLGNMKHLMTASFTFEVDGEILASAAQEALNGFTAMNSGSGDIQWTQIPGTSRLKGEVTLMFLNDSENGLSYASGLDVFRMVFDAKVLGAATMKLTGAKISGLNDDGDVAFLEWHFINGEATAQIIKSYSPYDLNKDEVVDQLDLTIAQRHYQKMLGEAGWDAASIADVNSDGNVDMLDLILIFQNYSK